MPGGACHPPCRGVHLLIIRSPGSASPPAACGGSDGGRRRRTRPAVGWLNRRLEFAERPSGARRHTDSACRPLAEAEAEGRRLVVRRAGPRPVFILLPPASGPGREPVEPCGDGRGRVGRRVRSGSRGRARSRSAARRPAATSGGRTSRSRRVGRSVGRPHGLIGNPQVGVRVEAHALSYRWLRCFSLFSTDRVGRSLT
jgi:hypothetical protein